MDSLPDWNDLRVFLAVARLGTISLAGERLGIEHSTVSRRIDRLEADLSVVLFDRRRTGYSLTDAGQALIPHAERMESALLEAVEESVGLGVRLKGSVRVGTPEGVGIHLIAPAWRNCIASTPICMSSSCPSRSIRAWSRARSKS
ncbi:MAG: hypothetical protein AzoDbin1_01621 [Azoarcus sp.]|nr:hypothetical protein [Azoarcus sp.]